MLYLYSAPNNAPLSGSILHAEHDLVIITILLLFCLSLAPSISTIFIAVTRVCRSFKSTLYTHHSKGAHNNYTTKE